MTDRLTKQSYEKMINEDIEWLLKQPETLERHHILLILRKAVEYEYESKTKNRKDNNIKTLRKVNMDVKHLEFCTRCQEKTEFFLTTNSMHKICKTCGDISELTIQQLKEIVAKNIVGQYNGMDKAEEAAKKEKEIHKGSIIPDYTPEIILNKGSYWIPDIMVQSKLSNSNGEAIRLIKNGGVYFDNNKIINHKENVNISSDHILKIGKRNFLKIHSK